MEIKLIDNSDKLMLQKITNSLVRQGWKKHGDIKEDVRPISYSVSYPVQNVKTIEKTHTSTVYYQKLTKGDEL